MSQGNLEVQKFALLIGVSECGSGFRPLRCPPSSVKALHNILTNPDIGGFSPLDVVALINPTVVEMQASIGELFSRCSPQDLMLFYFTGHGVTDERGSFFFTTRDTRKSNNGSLIRGTAVAASFVRDEMTQCRSRRQVAILDCCFSGAFPDGVVAMNDQSINIKGELGGEGRAILTAATSTQYALEQEGEDLSVYTRYLVQGLETGAAVPTSQEFIRVGDLHNYIRDQLQTAGAAMSPQIYAAGEGYEIILVPAPPINNELIYRKKAQDFASRNGGQLSEIALKYLKILAEKLNILDERARAIQREVEQPYHDYREILQKAVERNYPLSQRTREELREIQHTLQLTDEDVALIHEEVEQPCRDRLKRIEKEKRNSIKKHLLIAAIVVAVPGIIAVISKREGEITPPLPTSIPTSSQTPTSSLEPFKALISVGDNENLYGSRSSSDALKNLVHYRDQQRAGINQFIAGNYEAAVTTFREIRANGGDNGSSDPRKDPEILIFQNNSEARLNYQRQIGSQIYTIAAAIPLSNAEEKPKPFDIGQQILFGIAQAQAQAIKDGINLEVVIANDRNSPPQAEVLAKELSKPYITGSDGQRREILAVIGHYSSTVTCAALKFYNQAGLPVISPASTLTDMRSVCAGEKVFFRTIPSSEIEAKSLVNYLVERSGVDNPRIAAFYKEEGELFSPDMFRQFYKYLEQRLGEQTQITPFDLSNQLDFEKDKNQLNNFNVLAVFPDGRTSDRSAFDNAIKVLHSDAGSRLILGANPLYSAEVANPKFIDGSGQSNKLKVRPESPDKGLVVAVGWDPDCGSNPDFVREANTIWGGYPNRIYAPSYEAVQALVDRLKRGKTTRPDILSDLSDPERKVESYVFNGKTISFNQNGDRNEIQSNILVTPQDGIDFSPVPGEQSCSL